MILRLAACALLSFLAASAHADPRRIQGLFDGQIQSTGSISGQTEFFLTPDGTLAATYLFGPNKEDEGRLLHCTLTNYRLRCLWQDRYGAGDFIVRFTEDFCTFRGKWFPDHRPNAARDIERGFHWSGTRIDPPCGVTS